jgi:drug efflux transport system permease protein
MKTADPRAPRLPAEPIAAQPARGGALLRLRGLVRKESLQIVRDPSSISIAFALPAILLLLFGYGVSLDAKRVPVALVIENPTSATSSFADSLINSPYFAPIVLRDPRPATQALLAGTVDAMVVLRANFDRQIFSAQGAPIQVIVNGTDANTGRIVSGYVDGAWQKWLAQYAMARGLELTAPVVAEQRVWFNPEVRSRNFLVPGLIAIIMTLIGALLTALVVAREWERGTMEALIVTPVRIAEVLLGKLIPYFVLGMGGMMLSTAMAIFVFDVPFRGSFLVLLGVSGLFMLASLGMGLLISTVAKNQFVAGQIAIIIAFLPAFILSGFIFDIASMPRVVQWITQIIPARYFVASLQTLFLTGTVWPIVLPNAAALIVMAVIFLGLTRRKTRKSLE